MAITDVIGGQVQIYVSSRVLGFDPFARNLPTYVQPCELETVWKESEAISPHCPLTPENRNLIDAATLARCKKGMILEPSPAGE